MLAGRYVETGVLIAFLLLIGFCTRIDPALAQADDEQQAASDVEKLVDKDPIERVAGTRVATGS